MAALGWSGLLTRNASGVVFALASVVAAVIAGFLLHLGARQYLGYDSIWHVFIARQHDWRSFRNEVLENAHPPLFYLLLKFCIACFGKSFLAYRAASIAAIAVSVVLFAWLMLKLSVNPGLAVLGAAALGFSANSIEIGLEVRSYALFLAFELVALGFYLSWLGARPGKVSASSRAGFAASMSGALLSHYSGFFFLGATLAAPMILWILHPRWRARLRRELRQHPLGVVAMFTAPATVAVTLYVVHVSRFPRGFNHVTEFMLDPRMESPLHFVLRTSRDLELLFLPAGLHGTSASAVTVFLAAVLTWLMTHRKARGTLAVVPFVLLVPMVLVNLAAGLAGRYPYGGYLRHEIFLFPFAALSLFTGVELARRCLPGRWSSKPAWNLIVAAGVGVTTWTAVSSFAVSVDPIEEEPLTHFRQRIPEPAAVLTDQFTFILLFGEYHDWNWSIRWQDRAQPMSQVWDVSKGTHHLAVCREMEWLLDPSQLRDYSSAAACLRHAEVDQLAVFSIQQGGFTAPWRTEIYSFAQKLGPAAGLSLKSMFVDGDSFYGQLAGR
jgi:hypothetical protein